MVYPDDGNPVYERVLEALRSTMEAIATPQFHHDVERAFIYEGRQLMVGYSFPCVIVVPQADEITDFLACSAVVHTLDVNLIGAVGKMATSEQWKQEISWLMADMTKALADNIQLNGTAVWAEPIRQDTFDAGQDTLAFCKINVRAQYRHPFDNPSLTA